MTGVAIKPDDTIEFNIPVKYTGQLSARTPSLTFSPHINDYGKGFTQNWADIYFTTVKKDLSEVKRVVLLPTEFMGEKPGESDWKLVKEISKDMPNGWDAFKISKFPTYKGLAGQHVLIVGAGVCAIALGVALGRLGIPYTIVEKNAELGGTWWINRYPGCGVDTPNHSYSYSFGSGNAWTRYFCQREELLGYLQKVADEYGIRKHLRVNTELTSSRWDEGKRRWISTLRTKDGEETFESTALVSAIGPHIVLVICRVEIFFVVFYFTWLRANRSSSFSSYW
ncbi:NAD(P)-binding protein [Bradyrhizobium sp. WBAH23]|uniref:NAD(P)-binding protein n=1 Tax=Bradyrhizobium sp. WBAH23 TaxID=1390119 RepID=UPI00224089DC|nr:NAD(P)/FAD-dependent oxidoreductase [Bradyrhizobium sp. WBAH23]